MVDKFREFLTTAAGKGVAVVGLLLAIALMVYVVMGAFANSDADTANQRIWWDTATGKTFPYTLKEGDVVPIKAPSGGNTGYPTEKCFWTKEGTVKTTPTYVLLKSNLHQSGETFCPDCGRRVVVHNPEPDPNNLKPPPTEEQWKKNGGR